jgi:HK97 gp10 family phage protein
MAKRIVVRGTEDALRALEQVEAGTKQALGLAVRAGAAPVRDAAVAKAPVGPTGNLRKGMRVSVSVRGSVASAKVSSKARHAAIVSRGTGERAWKNGKSTGSMPANDFLQDALRAAETAAIQAVATVYRAAITKAGL